jgi:hypothetical protein
MGISRAVMSDFKNFQDNVNSLISTIFQPFGSSRMTEVPFSGVDSMEMVPLWW